MIRLRKRSWHQEIEIQQIAPVVGGKGGGKPDNARGGGKDVAKLDEALAKALSLL